MFRRKCREATEGFTPLLRYPPLFFFFNTFLELSENQHPFFSHLRAKNVPNGGWDCTFHLSFCPTLAAPSSYLLWAKLLRALICGRHQNKDFERESLTSAEACRPIMALPRCSLVPSAHTSPFPFYVLFSFSLSEAHFSHFSLPVSFACERPSPPAALVGDHILWYSNHLLAP